MPEFISESEMERIAEFAKTPVYMRKPEQLMPEQSADDEE
jgi:hypothetical protein